MIGKAGRAMTATDPAPLEMFETVVNLKPKSEWRPGMTKEKIRNELWTAVDMPGVSQAWTQPIKARIDMLATGIRTPVGIKLFGDDLGTLNRLAVEIERAVKGVPGTASVFAERITGGYYLDIEIRREEAARYGLKVNDIQDVISSAIGGGEHHLDGRGARALSRERPVRARAPRRHPEGRPGSRSHAAGRAHSAGAGRKPDAPPGAAGDPERERAAVGLGLRGCPGRDIGSYVREAQEAVRRNVKLRRSTTSSGAVSTSTWNGRSSGSPQSAR